MIAMMLAGHNNIEMSAHYYSNITTLIECKTYKQYRKVLKGNVTYNISPKVTLPLDVKDFVLLDDKGKCYSSNFLSGDYSDCKRVSGPDGEIGYCPNCIYYRRDRNSDFFKGDNIYKRRIEDDCKYLAEITKQVRTQKGSQEDILQVMLKLQNSSFAYQQYCEEKLLTQRESTDGTEEIN